MRLLKSIFTSTLPIAFLLPHAAILLAYTNTRTTAGDAESEIRCSAAASRRNHAAEAPYSCCGYAVPGSTSPASPALLEDSPAFGGGQFPGGSEAFEVAAKFCYGVKIDFTAAKIDSSVMPMTEDLGLVQRCIDAISSKAALVGPSLFGLPVNESRGRRSRSSPAIKVASAAEPWFEELSVLCTDLFNRALEAMKAPEVNSDVIEWKSRAFLRKFDIKSRVIR